MDDGGKGETSKWKQIKRKSSNRQFKSNNKIKQSKIFGKSSSKSKVSRKSETGKLKGKPFVPTTITDYIEKSTVSTLSSETIRFHELFPRLADFGQPPPPIPRTRSDTLIVDWKYLSTCSGKTSFLLIFECLLILTIVVFTRNTCKDASGKKGLCPFRHALGGLALATMLFNFIIFLLYTFHLIEKFNQLCWLRIEFTCHLVYTAHFAIMSWLILLDANVTGFILGLLGIAAAFNGLILSLDKLIRVCTGKPAQLVLDDADGNRTRIGIMRLRFGVRQVN